MTKLTKALEVTTKDNMATAFGKGMIRGTISSSLVCLALGGIVLALGIVVKGKELSEEVGE